MAEKAPKKAPTPKITDLEETIEAQAVKIEALTKERDMLRLRAR